MALEMWKAKAIGSIPPSEGYPEAMVIYYHCLPRKKLPTISSLNKNIESYICPYHEKNFKKKIRPAILKVIAHVSEILELLQLIETDEGRITNIQSHRIQQIERLLKNVKKSVERTIRWTCYFLVSQDRFRFTVDDILKYNLELNQNQVAKVLEGTIGSECQRKGIKFDKQGDNYVISEGKNSKAVRECLIGALEVPSRRTHHEDDILHFLDRSPYTNKDLARILKVDKSTISRKIKKLAQQENKIKSPDQIIAAKGHQYWITNCDNCPWGFTREGCRSNSIDTLKQIARDWYDVEFDDSYFEDIKTNQALKYLAEMFQEVPDQNFVEKEKRILLGKIIRDIQIGPSNIQISSSGSSIKNGDKKQLRLPILYIERGAGPGPLNRNPNQESSFDERIGRLTLRAMNIVDEIVLLKNLSITHDHLLDMMDEKKRMIGPGNLTDEGALFLVAADLGLGLSEP